jgi:hypothetical protein
VRPVVAAPVRLLGWVHDPPSPAPLQTPLENVEVSTEGASPVHNQVHNRCASTAAKAREHVEKALLSFYHRREELLIGAGDVLSPGRHGPRAKASLNPSLR